VRRDLAVLVDQSVPVAALTDCIRALGEPLIRDVQIFDVYQGEGVPEQSKSIAVSLVLQDFSQTLTESEIDAIFNNVLSALSTQLNAKLRD
jgi:phenylalanyl-tRNA synthetase beta chain